MSQKKAKKKRKIQNDLSNLLKAQTYNVVTEYVNKIGKDFDQMDPVEKLRVVAAAKSIAIQDVNNLLAREAIDSAKIDVKGD